METESPFVPSTAVMDQKLDFLRELAAADL